MRVSQCFKNPIFGSFTQSHHGHLYLQGEDRLYLNLGGSVSADAPGFHLTTDIPTDNLSQTLAGCKQWLVVPIPSAYSGSNWPIRVSNEILFPAAYKIQKNESAVRSCWALFHPCHELWALISGNKNKNDQKTLETRKCIKI